jgi:hypothetical protein
MRVTISKVLGKTDSSEVYETSHEMVCTGTTLTTGTLTLAYDETNLTRFQALNEYSQNVT